MKTYILRDLQAVQPQSAPGPEPPAPETAAPAEHRFRAGERGPALYIGLDVHTESIAVSLARSESTEVRRYGQIGGTHDDVLRLAKQFQAAFAATACTAPAAAAGVGDDLSGLRPTDGGGGAAAPAALQAP